MSTNTRDRLRQQAELRAAFMTLHPSAAWHLFPPLHATALMQFDYDLLAEQCQCKTRSHRRKACVLNGQGRCRSCGAYTPDNGSYPLQCPGCHDWEDTRMRYLGQWALDHDDRNQLPDTVFQASLFASDQPFQFEQVPQPRWPFNWSRRPLEHIGPEGACFMCGNTDAPGSYEWDTPESLTLHWTCTPCKYLANHNARFDEGPVDSIEQAQQIISGRNSYGFDISELWEPFRKRTLTPLHAQIAHANPDDTSRN